MAQKRSTGCGPVLLGVVLALAYTQGRLPDLTGQLRLPGLGSTGSAGSGGTYVRPAAGEYSSGWGPRWGATHYGIDITAPVGAPIRAVTDGHVIEAGPASGFGLWTRIRHPDGTVTVYGHMHTLAVTAGDAVQAGEQIATVGARGDSTGPHLHFEVWPHGQRSQRIDPASWLNDRGVHL